MWAPDWKVSFFSKLSSFWADVPQSTSSPFDFSFCSPFLNSGSLEVSRANCCMSVSRGPRGRKVQGKDRGCRSPLCGGWSPVRSGLSFHYVAFYIFFLFFSYVLYGFLSFNPDSSCLSLSSTGIIGEGHHAQLTLLLSFGLKAKDY